ncbi:CzcE family metal-binding protein [Massilia sp. RP-1-19]|uniref:CzcE family metal-binding protein n=1 Tax=Massilia polaris TaxID=2728846 RepID=A0A848HFQ4_9BURK|nr:CzcE family metal-binding protein [Massilia polaris]NML59802.1 CzcE family metal-binding protein [Massilia polaris]
MLNLNRAAILLLSVVLASGAHAIGPTGTDADFGTAVSDTAAQRTIALDAGTKSVNVVNGETVKFTTGGKSFSWHVSTYPNVNQFDLEKIAPKDVSTAGVQVYVSPSAQYLGN